MGIGDGNLVVFLELWERVLGRGLEGKEEMG